MGIVETEEYFHMGYIIGSVDLTLFMGWCGWTWGDRGV